jgi:UDP-N-acetyl-D-glucosamine dehydrogenase
LREGAQFESVPIAPEVLIQADCVVIVTGHADVDYDQVVEHAQLVIDAVNATRDVRNGRDKIVRLGGMASG